MENKELTCIVCPIGCQLKLEIEDNKIICIKGNNCKRGAVYAEQEYINPTRMLTTTMRVHDGTINLVSVKSENPLPKGLIMKCMSVINSVKLSAPIHIGDIVVENILDTGINIVATKNVERLAVKMKKIG